MKWVTMIPAYGRDYHSAKAVRKDFEANKDFIIEDISSPYDGRPVNRQDLRATGASARIRYNKLRKIVMLDLTKEE